MSFFRIALPALFGVLAFCGCSAAVAGIADPCALSPLAGTVCADGSLYAGAFARSSRPLFAMPCDLGMEGTLSGGHWRCSGVRSVFAHGGTKAGKACASQTFGGHDDWVLPSLEELMLLCRGGSEFALGSCPAVSLLQMSEDPYWSVSDGTPPSLSAWTVQFDSGIQAEVSKDVELPVRCVRR